MSNPKRRSGGRGGAKAAEAKVPNPMQRIEDLETNMQQLANLLMKVQNNVNFLSGIVEALESIEGSVKVQDTKDGLLRQRAKESVAMRVTEGVLEPVETIGEDSLVVGMEYDAKGELIRPGLLQTNFSDFIPAAKLILLGKSVGFEWALENGYKFIVTEIYGPGKVAGKAAEGQTTTLQDTAEEQTAAPVAATETPAVEVVHPDAIIPPNKE